MARAGENGKYRQWYDASIEAKHWRQLSHLRISDIERVDQCSRVMPAEISLGKFAQVNPRKPENIVGH
jgi:hypothetical protein